MFPPRYLTYFAYSSSGTPSFLAIATCEGVSFTDLLRPVFALRLAEATVWTDRVLVPESSLNL